MTRFLTLAEAGMYIIGVITVLIGWVFGIITLAYWFVVWKPWVFAIVIAALFFLIGGALLKRHQGTIQEIKRSIDPEAI